MPSYEELLKAAERYREDNQYREPPDGVDLYAKVPELGIVLGHVLEEHGCYVKLTVIADIKGQPTRCQVWQRRGDGDRKLIETYHAVERDAIRLAINTLVQENKWEHGPVSAEMEQERRIRDLEAKLARVLGEKAEDLKEEPAKPSRPPKKSGDAVVASPNKYTK